MGVGWPPENTMNLKIVEAVYTVGTVEPGHPDQYPYIDSRLGLPQEKAMAPHSSALAWRIPGTGEPGGLPSVACRVKHD